MTSDDSSYILGLPFDGPPSHCVPVKACGSIVYLDEEGNVETWHYTTNGMVPYEAMGLCTEHLAILQDSAPYVYFNIGEDEEEEYE
jgi:hypothetical protein